MIHSDYHCKNMCIIFCTFLIALNFTYIYGFLFLCHIMC